MTDRILAIASLVLLIGFMGIVVWFVNEPDLWIVVLVVLAMASYDFWITLRNGKNGKADPKG